MIPALSALMLALPALAPPRAAPIHWQLRLGGAPEHVAFHGDGIEARTLAGSGSASIDYFPRALFDGAARFPSL